MKHSYKHLEGRCLNLRMGIYRSPPAEGSTPQEERDTRSLQGREGQRRLPPPLLSARHGVLAGAATHRKEARNVRTGGDGMRLPLSAGGLFTKKIPTLSESGCCKVARSKTPSQGQLCFSVTDTNQPEKEYKVTCSSQ